MMVGTGLLERVDTCAAARAEGSASDEAHPSEENRRADERGHREGSASDEAHPSEENRRADERGHS
jgi:hypothetical protein